MSEAYASAYLAWPHTTAARLSGGKYETPPHVKLISRTIVECIDDKSPLLVIEAPPRHSKSETVSRWLPLWYLLNYPDRHVILASYSGDLARSNSRIVRNLLAEHGPPLGVQLAGDSTAVDRWHTSVGGSCAGVGVGGTITGFGAHLFIVDDPVKDSEEADSETMRNKVIEWFQSTAYTRREPGAFVVVMCTRWHESDLVGWVTDHPELSKRMRRITLPAIAERDDPIGRIPGEPLWPERFDVAALDEIRSAISMRWWQALYMQRPTAAEGAEIKRSWWRYYEELPVPWQDMEYRLQSVDATFTNASTSDYVVSIIFGVFGGQRYVLDMVRKRMTFTETCEMVAKQHTRWQCHASAIELAANGQALVDSLQSAIPGLYGVKVSNKGKVARARAQSPQIQAGNVLLPKGAKFSEEIVEEHAAFPLGKNDDTVDAMSQGLSELSQFTGIPVSHLKPGDDRFVGQHLIELQKKGVLGNVFRAPKSWRL